MGPRPLTLMIALLCTGISLGGSKQPTLGAVTSADTPVAAGKLFGLNKIVAIQIEIPAQEYQAMQPAMPAGGFGGPPPAPRPKRAGGRASERNLFGVEFPWARGSLTAVGQTRNGVALRYAGNASYMASAAGLKRSFKVELGPVDQPDLNGLRSLNLQSGALDPTKARESLAYALFRDARVPAPRTALAEVTLTVPGKYDKAYLGVYTLVEPVDQAFLNDRFHTDKGVLFKPQGLRGIDFLGDDWEKYQGPYQPQSEPTPAECRRLIEFARLVQRDGDERFQKEIGSYLDVDKFLRFMAVQALVANADGFFTLGYNYYLYLDPASNRFVFIPGEQDLAFANFLMMGIADQLMDMSLAASLQWRQPAGGPVARHQGVFATRIAESSPSSARRCSARSGLLADLAAIESVAQVRCSSVRRPRGRSGRSRPAASDRRAAPPAPDLRTFADEAVGVDRRSARGQERRLSPPVQFRPASRGSAGETNRRPDDRRGCEGAAGVPGHAVRGAAEGRLSRDPGGGTRRRGVCRRGRARIARPQLRAAAGCFAASTTMATARPTASTCSPGWSTRVA